MLPVTIEIDETVTVGHPQRASLRGNPAGSLKPFKRAGELFQRVCDVHAQHPDGGVPLQIALTALPAYVSHGHGGKHRTKNRTITGRWIQDRSKYAPHQNQKECARRVLQSLPPDQQALARSMSKQLFEEMRDEQGVGV